MAKSPASAALLPKPLVRHRKALVPRTFPLRAIYRLGQRAGIKTFGKPARVLARRVLSTYANHLVKASITFMVHDRRTTVKAGDVRRALVLDGRRIYGYK